MAILEHRCTFKAAASVSVLLCAIHAFLQHMSGWTHRLKTTHLPQAHEGV